MNRSQRPLLSNFLLPLLIGGYGYGFPNRGSYQTVHRPKSPLVPRDDAGHMAAAEAKRQRKAAKRERDRLKSIRAI